MFVSILITQLCLGFSGREYSACSKAVRAAGIETGVIKDLNGFEKRTTNLILHEVAETTGEEVLVAFAIARKIAMDQALTYPLIKRSKGLVPSVVPTIGLKASSINFGWRF